MPEYISALIYDSSINLAGLERDRKAAIDKLHSIGTEATKTFQNDIARGLAKSVRPENFASDVAKTKALLGSIGPETSKIFERELGRNLARKTLKPFLDESRSLGAQIKSSLGDVFSIRNIAGGFLTASAITGAVRGLFEVGKATIAIARDAVETRNKFDVLFGDLKGEVRQFVNVYAQEVGRSRVQTENFISTINGIFTTVGFAGREAAEFSKNITKLTFDLASFFNTTDDEALTALRAGLIGESEPLRRFNVFLSEARVAQEALAQGINKTSKELTDQDKIFLRYQIILKDTVTAQGDAVRTSDSLANQQKRLSANLENLGDTIGEILVPSLADATKGLNTFLENLTKTFTGKNASLISSFFGSIREDARFMQEQLDEISKNRTTFILPVQENSLKNQAELIKRTLQFQDELQSKLDLGVVTIEAHQNIWEKSKAQLEKMVALGGEQAKQAREELKKREEIEDVIKRTTDALELLRAASPFDKELITISQKFEKAREEAHGSLKALRLLAQQEEIEINKAVDSLLKVTAEKLFALTGGEERFRKQLNKELVTSLPVKLLLEIRSVDIKKTELQKLPDQIRDTLSNIGYPFKAFLIDLEKIGVATEDELVGLLDLFDRRLGDIGSSLFDFVGQITNPTGTVLGNLLAGANLLKSVFSGLGIFASDTNVVERQRQVIERQLEAQRLLDEQGRESFRSLEDALKELRDALVGANLSIAELETSLRSNIGLLSLFAPALNNDLIGPLQDVIKVFLSVGRKAPETVAEINAFLNDILLIGTDSQKAAAQALLQALATADAATREAILKAFGGLIAGLQGITDFGKEAGRQFDDLINRLNLRFNLFNIDDPIKKLDLLSKSIKEKFNAIIPTTEAGIRTLIEQGLAALEAGGQTLVDFLKSLDLEELTADQFRDLLQLLNQLANEAKSKVDDISDAASESVISQVRQITFEQGNAVIDNLVTSRIVLTNILDAELQMLDIARRNNVSAGVTGGAANKNNFFFFENGKVTSVPFSSLSQLQKKMYEDAVAAAGGKGLS